LNHPVFLSCPPSSTTTSCLHTDAARELYHRYAESEPIYDYHCHLPPDLIASNHQFADLAELWLGGDHYKWRAMRTNGVNERFVTGDGSPREKFEAWAETVPHTLAIPSTTGRTSS
jgi:glucuronate isomerase